MLTLLTPTGCRPEAFELCQRWMAHQTYQGPVRWIVVDDGETPQDVTFQREGWTVEVLRPRPYWQPGKNTQHRNFLAGLERIGPDDRLLFIEDDDYYSPQWLEIINHKLDEHDLVGQGCNHYYHVRTGAIKLNDNMQHASLCASAIKGREAIEVFRTQCIRGHRLIDLQLWKHCRNKQVFKGLHVIGMKGLPGRAGIAGGHNLKTESPFDLSQWIGDDARHYKGFMA